MAEGSSVEKGFNFKAVPDFSVEQLQNPIFVIGCGHSGISLMAQLLEMHRDVANWSGADEIWDPGWFPWRPENHDKPPLEYAPYAFKERWWKENKNRQDEIRAVFGTYQWIRRKSYFVNASPVNTFRIPQLMQMFPNARLVHVVRDGRAVVQGYSMRLKREVRLPEWPEEQQKLFVLEPDEFALWIARYWRQSVEEVNQQDQALNLTGKGILIELSYEELHEKPVDVLRRVCVHCGLDTQRLVLASDQDLPEPSHEPQWRDRLSPELVEKLVATMQPEFSQRGYK